MATRQRVHGEAATRTSACRMAETEGRRAARCATAVNLIKENAMHSSIGMLMPLGHFRRGSVIGGERELRELRKKVTFAIFAEEDDLNKVTTLVDSIFAVLQRVAIT